MALHSKSKRATINPIPHTPNGAGRLSLLPNPLQRRTTITSSVSRSATGAGSSSSNKFGAAVLPFIAKRGIHQKDPRPMLAKEAQTEMVQKLDQFLYGFLEEGYAFDKNDKNRLLEIELPNLLKSIGYSIPLNKSCFQTLGTPHSWPPILAALCWLTDVIEFGMNFDPHRHLLPGLTNEFLATPTANDGEPVISFTYQYYCNTFINASDGGTSFESFDQHLADMISGGQADDHDRKQLLEERSRLIIELQEFEEKEIAIEEFAKQNNNVLDDFNQLQRFAESMKIYVEERSVTKKELEDRLALTHSNSEAMKESIRNKRQQIAHQEITPAELEAINCRLEEMKKIINMHREERLKVEQDVSELQNDITASKRTVEDKALILIRRAQQVVLVSSGFEDFTSDIQTLTLTSVDACRKSYQPQMDAMKNQLLDEQRTCGSKLLIVKEEVKRLRSREHEAEELLATAHTNAAKCDQDLLYMQEDSAPQLKIYRMKLADVTSRVEIETRRKKGNCMDKEAALQELGQMIEQKKTTFEKEILFWNDLIEKFTKITAEHVSVGRTIRAGLELELYNVKNDIAKLTP